MTYLSRSGLRAVAVVAACVVLSPLHTGPTLAQQAPTPQAAPAAQAAPPVEDPLGRETPRGAFLGFVRAAELGNLSQAGQFLQWPRQGMRITREDAARQLSYVLNHSYDGSLDQLSRSPAGTFADGEPEHLERVGVAVLSDGTRVDLTMTRTGSPDEPSLWLFSADTVVEIPKMYAGSGMPEFERRLPRLLTRTRFGEMSLWVPLALLLLLFVLYEASRALLWCTAAVIRLFGRLRGHAAVPARWRMWWALSRPSAFLVTIGLHRLFAPVVGIPLLYRYYYDRLSILLLLAGVVWWLWTLIDLTAESVRHRLEVDHPRTAQSMYTVGRRILKGASLGLAVLIGLAAMGVNLSATLAGLGIGGVALAFASQKTLENIFGGVSMLSDRSIVVGDFCRIGSHIGTVEDVGLRTTQLRTLDRTVVHIPNGSLATQDVENFARRDKFFFRPTIGLRYETSLDQLQRVLGDIRQMLQADSRIDQSNARARFLRLGTYSLDVEIFAYVAAADYPAFLAVQEELLMRIMTVVKDAGTGLAFPSQTMYVQKDRGPDGEASAADAV